MTEFAAPSTAQLERECKTFCRYLVGRAPSKYVQRKYAAAHPILHAAVPDSSFDRLLVRVAAASSVLARLADAYSTNLARRSALRVKLVLLIALLEVAPDAHTRFFSARPARPSAVFVMLAAHGLGFALASVVAILLFGPMHLALQLGRRRRPRAGEPAALSPDRA